MKRILILTLTLTTMLVTGGAMAQWTRTNGPDGAGYLNLAAENGVIIGVDDFGVVRHRLGAWEEVSRQPLDGVMLAGGIAIGYRAGQYHRSMDLGVTWEAMDVESGVFPISTAFYRILRDTLYRSGDGGRTWTVRGRLPAEVSRPVLLNGDLYVLSGMRRDALYRSENDGATWTLVRSAIGPQSSGNRWLAAGNNALFLSWENDTVLRSDDGGWTWTDASAGLDTAQRVRWITAGGNSVWAITNTDVLRLENGRWKAMQAGPVFGPGHPIAGGLLLTTAYGPYVLRDDADSVTPFNDGLNRSTIVAMGTAGDVAIVSTGMTLFRSDDNGATWQPSAAIDATDIASMQDGTAMTVGGELHRSSDGGRTWQRLTPLGGDRDNDYHAIVADGNDVYVGHGMAEYIWETGSSRWKNGGVLRSTDGGDTWQPMTAGLPTRDGSYPPVYDLLVHDGIIMIATVDGIYRWKDGSRWVRAVNGLPEHNGYNGGGVLYAAGGDIVAMTDLGLFETSDGGSNWAPIAGGLPPVGDEYGIPFAVDGTLFQQTVDYEQTATYVRTYMHDGEQWQDVTDSMPSNVLVLTMMRSGDRIFAGTSGFGVWRFDPQIAGVDGDRDAALAVAIAPNPAAGMTTIGFSLATRGDVRVSLVSVLGEVISEVFRGPLDSGTYRRQVDLTRLPQGAYFIRLDAAGRSVLRRIVVQ